MTKKQIKENIDRLEAEMHKLRSYENIEGYKELRNQLQKMKDDYEKLILPKLNLMRDEINRLKAEYAKPVKERPVLSENLKDWFYKWTRGIDFGYKYPYIRWNSRDEKYVIITTPGSIVGQGTAMGSGGYYHASTRHYLVKVIEGAAWIDRVCSKVSEHEGKLDKETMQNWIKLTKE